MGKVCPLLTFDPDQPVECIEHNCMFYTQVQGQNPQTGEMVNEWGCAIAWTPVLLIENSQQMRQAGAGIDKLTNEVCREGERGRQFWLGLTQDNSDKLEGGNG